MLGRRENLGDHEAMRKKKIEFMVNWNGLGTKDKEWIVKSLTFSNSLNVYLKSVSKVFNHQTNGWTSKLHYNSMICNGLQR